MSELKPCPFCGGELQYLCTEGGLKRYCHENDKKKNPNGCPLHDYHCCQYDLDIWNTRAQQQPSDTQPISTVLAQFVLHLQHKGYDGYDLLAQKKLFLAAMEQSNE